MPTILYRLAPYARPIEAAGRALRGALAAEDLVATAQALLADGWPEAEVIFTCEQLESISVGFGGAPTGWSP